MLLAAKRIPFKDRAPLMFWRGADTNVQRAVMKNSILVQESGLADIDLLTWTSETFADQFVTLPEHCERK